MKKKLWLLFIVSVVSFASCSKPLLTYSLKGSALLQDNKTVVYNVSVFFESKEGLDEMERKADKIRLAVRIITVQRGSKDMDNPGRLNSILTKVFKSQLRHEVAKIKINLFRVD